LRFIFIAFGRGSIGIDEQKDDILFRKELSFGAGADSLAGTLLRCLRFRAVQDCYLEILLSKKLKFEEAVLKADA